MIEEPTFTVAEVSQVVGHAVTRAFPEPVWVRGEIRDLTRSPSGHVYFNLVDPADGGGAAPPLLPVTLFVSDREAVNRTLYRAGAGRMTDGVEVRIRGTIAHYAQRGSVQMRMTSIDTEFTLGRLAAERDRILRVLAAEGMLERNGALPFPAVPLRVGLVTSVGSAAHADFLHEIEAPGFAFHVLVADARVQGAGAEASLVGALDAVCAAGAEVVAIVRGGGSRLDLATFDREVVARAVAMAPVPVITGIGHETDETVVDRVAAAAYKTPTACAAAMVARVAGFVRSLDGAAARLSGVTRRATTLGTRRLDDGSARLRRAAAVALGRRNVEIGNRARRVGRGGVVAIRDSHQAVAGKGRRVVAAAGRHQVHRDMEIQALRARLGAGPRAVARSAAAVDSAEARVQSLDPRRALARGWSITRDGKGRVVRASSAVAPGELLATTVFDGVVTSRVEEPSGTALPTGGLGATIGAEEAG